MIPGGYWPPSSKVEIANFGGGTNCSSWSFIGFIFLEYVRGTKTFFRFCAGKFSSAAPTIMDARSSLRWLSSSWQWHYYAIISDSTNEPPTIWAKYCGYKYNCLRLLACMPIASISMCSNTLYLFIGETRFRYCGYSCLWNFRLLQKSCKSSNVV